MEADSRPCGYCACNPPCESTDPEHEGMACEACAAISFAEPHPECLASVRAYMEESER